MYIITIFQKVNSFLKTNFIFIHSFHVNRFHLYTHYCYLQHNASKKLLIWCYFLKMDDDFNTYNICILPPPAARFQYTFLFVNSLKMCYH